MGVRGWQWWTDFVRLIGVAYLLGLSALMILMTYEVIAGIPIGIVTILANSVGLLTLGLVVGRLRGFAAPGLRPPDWQFPRISLFVALFVAGIVVYFESLFELPDWLRWRASGTAGRSGCRRRKSSTRPDGWSRNSSFRWRNFLRIRPG